MKGFCYQMWPNMRNQVTEVILTALVSTFLNHATQTTGGESWILSQRIEIVC
jgi:hypothetical protein